MLQNEKPLIKGASQMISAIPPDKSGGPISAKKGQAFTEVLIFKI